MSFLCDHCMQAFPVGVGYCYVTLVYMCAKMSLNYSLQSLMVKPLILKRALIEKSLVYRNLLSVLKTVGAGGIIPVHACVHK